MDLGPTTGVRQALSRLAKTGPIRRIGRGLYEYPRTSPSLGVLSPDPDKVAKALAGKDALRLQPTGAYAANRLHLSKQVPTRLVYLTDGPSRKVQIDHQTIELRNASLKRMQVAGRVSGLVFEALRHLGKEHIGEKEIATLRQQLNDEEKRKVLKDLPLAPGWMHEILRKITDPDWAGGA